MHMRRLASVTLLLAGFTISACTAFFVPDQDDDGVARCDTTEDCPDTGDNRYIAACVFGEGQPENSDKVCSVDFAEINCSPEAYAGDSAFAELHADATSNQNKAAYSSCIEENRGKQGCRPGVNGCDDGLEDIEGICDDPDALFPSISPSQVEDGVDAVAGQDIKDQFCRYYFCDPSFVCDSSGAKQICKPCDPSKEWGQGGCGTLYLQGAPSTVYTSDVDNDGNCSGNKGTDEVEFGPINEVPAP